jgi:8-oxo-dGTP diphosphatase
LSYDPRQYDRPSLTVDVVLIGMAADRLSVLLGPRDRDPFAGMPALPGGFVGIDEPLDAAAARVLRDKAGLRHAHLEQLYTFGRVDRDPRMRIVTVAYLALLRPDAFAAAAAGPLSPVALGGALPPLAFDHADILALARDRLRGKIDYSDIGFALLPDPFTLRQLQQVHEAVLGTPLNKAAFRRRMLDRGWIAPTGTREADASHRPAELFRHRSPA